MQSSANLRGLTWKELVVEAAASLTSELDVLLTSKRLGGWVVEAEEPQLKWVCYLPCEKGWEARLTSLLEDLRALGATVSLRGDIVDEDWAECWKQFYHTRKVGNSLIIRPSWEEYQANPGEHVITLDPGMAFGTGYHASTSMCMELIEKVFETSSPRRILDVGTGSGILTIAALLLGAEEVLASDSDPVAVRVAAENIELNGFADKTEVREYIGVPEGQYDLVEANLIAALLCELSADLAKSVAPGGRLVVGGIVEERADEVIAAFDKCGMTVEHDMRRETWVSLCLKAK